MGNLISSICGGGGAPAASKAPGGGASGAPEPRVINCRPHTDSIASMCAAGPGKVVTCSEDRTIKLWNWETGEIVQTWRGHTKGVTKVCYAPLANLAFSASRDQTIKAWALGAETPAMAFGGEGNAGGHRLTIPGLAVSEDHGWVCSGSRDTTVRLWDLARGDLLSFKEVQRNLVTAMRAIPGESSVVQASEDLHLRVWDCRQLAVSQVIPGHVNIPRGLDVSPCGNYFLTSCNGFEGAGCEARLWDRRTGQELRQMHGHAFAADACTFVPLKAAVGDDPLEGLLGVTGSADKTLRLWDTSRGDCLATESVAPGVGSGPVTCVERLQPTMPAWKAGGEAAQQGVVGAANFGGGFAVYGVWMGGAGGGWLELEAHTPLEG